MKISIHDFLLPHHGAFVNGGKILEICMLAANIMNKQSWIADQDVLSDWGFGVRLTSSHCFQKCHLGLRTRHIVWPDHGREKWTRDLTLALLGAPVGRRSNFFTD